MGEVAEAGEADSRRRRRNQTAHILQEAIAACRYSHSSGSAWRPGRGSGRLPGWDGKMWISRTGALGRLRDTTMTYYTEVGEKDLRDAVAKLKKAQATG